MRKSRTESGAEPVVSLEADLAATPYRLGKKLGAGGMATVFEVEHRALGKQQVLKVLHERYANDDSTRDRFRLEAQAQSRLDHPNLLRVVDFGETPSGRLYLVSERLRGESLSELLHRVGTLPVEQALAFAREALDGLGYAHKRGLVHRDVKPGNLFVCERDDAGRQRLVVLDFGVAKVLARGGAHAAPTASPVLLTEAGAIVGTPSYLAPEQAAGQELDQRADLYAMGLVVYRMLAGRGPFAYPDPLAMVAAHVTELPKPPSAFAAQPIPAALDAVVLRALAKDRADRVPTALAMAAALEEAVAPPRAGAAGGARRAEPRADAAADATRAEGPAANADRAARASAPLDEGGDPLVCEIGKTYGGDYLVKSLLARGGIAEVYVAEHAIMRRLVAFKVLNRRYARRPDVVRRAESEARALAEVDHPAVVKILSAGRDPEVGLFIAMELLRGKSLREVMFRLGRLPARTAVLITLAIAEATRALHDLEIFHRDLKPENVMLIEPRTGRAPGTPGQVDVKVLDLGAAKAKYGARTTDHHKTMGTGKYMSPEQILGKPITAASDVYALGLMLYEMLLGRHAFGENHVGVPTHYDFCIWQLHAPVAPLTQLLPDRPPGLWAVVGRAVEKEASARFQSMVDFAAALRSALGSGAAAPTERDETPETAAVVGEALTLASRTPAARVEEATGAPAFAALAEGGGTDVIDLPISATATTDLARRPVPEAPAVRAVQPATEEPSGERLRSSPAAAGAPKLATEARASLRPWLMVVSSPDPSLEPGHRFELAGRAFMIGSSKRASLVVVDPELDPVGGLFELTPTGATVVALGGVEGAIGTEPLKKVDDQAVGKVAHGDLFTLGGTVFAFFTHAAADDSAASPPSAPPELVRGRELSPSDRTACDADDQALPTARLVVLEAEDATLEREGGPRLRLGTEYPLVARRTVIGRAPSAHVSAFDIFLSAAHAVLVAEAEPRRGHRLWHVSQSNPTLVNGREAWQEVLRDGDRIQMGTTVFAYVTDASAGAPRSLTSPLGPAVRVEASPRPGPVESTWPAGRGPASRQVPVRRDTPDEPRPPAAAVRAPRAEPRGQAEAAQARAAAAAPRPRASAPRTPRQELWYTAAKTASGGVPMLLFAALLLAAPEWFQHNAIRIGSLVAAVLGMVLIFWWHFFRGQK
ncbi:MAG: protein kinase [Myxococcales bacterium]|nr:protein kinase [Myxococcales bacterium]